MTTVDEERYPGTEKESATPRKNHLFSSLSLVLFLQHLRKEGSAFEQVWIPSVQTGVNGTEPRLLSKLHDQNKRSRSMVLSYRNNTDWFSHLLPEGLSSLPQLTEGISIVSPHPCQQILLKAAALKETDDDSLTDVPSNTKRRTLVKCLFRLLINCGSKRKNFLFAQKNQLKKDLYIILEEDIHKGVPAKSLAPLTSDSSTVGNILGAIGLSSQYKLTPRARFLALSLMLFLYAQITTDGKIRKNIPCELQEHKENENQDEMDNNGKERAEVTNTRIQLYALKQNKAYIGLTESIDWVLNNTAEKNNTIEATREFIACLVVDKLYVESYLKED
ncbi:EPG5 [Lepeophtheirus salmonis]|uniref:EPG5 n=1 Tax=Lepeophtheirus salmonis TaxID=72036 RepID=A0A7R8CA92_LEPSM|nr:EPG5 [Lepeophtheirus salmonis]CAF2749073.1 EPG5 [Lepeophtheirus salmonis]